MREQLVMLPVSRLVPDWVPIQAINYLEHTEQGASIRALARRAGCHASTVLRQVRTYESRRDDHLVDLALRRLSKQVSRPDTGTSGSSDQENPMMNAMIAYPDEQALSEARFERQARDVLKCLSGQRAVLAVADGMENAVVVIEGTDGVAHKSKVVDRQIAEAMALKNWISCSGTGRVLRYRITSAGQSALNRLLAQAENRASGFAEAQADFMGVSVLADEEGPLKGRARYGQGETPLSLLARRRDRNGKRFLSTDLVRAGEQLREDFETSQFEPGLINNWEDICDAVQAAEAAGENQDHSGLCLARSRVKSAVYDLGPGLGDVALRCCCLLEGLEKAEKRMGWSARSGKIVLRIALQRLKRHYDSLGEVASMIG